MGRRRAQNLRESKSELKIVCIPAYNAERTIARVVIGCQQYVDLVVVCDDGSEDLTGTIAERVGAQVVRHDRNMGKGEALRTLFLAARKMNAEIMITLDADGQHDPHEIPKILNAFQQGSPDVVIGSRFLSAKSLVPRHRMIVNRMLNAITPIGVSDTQSGFRGYGKHAIQTILPAEMGMGVDSEILMQASSQSLKIVEVPVSVKYGEGKTSTHNPVFHTLDVIFSVVKVISIRHPLLFYGTPGLVLLVIGLVIALRTLERVSAQGIVTNITLTYGLLAIAITLIGLVTLFTGVILFTLGTLIRSRRNE